MSEENNRKASDILLALEAKVETLSKQVQNIDNNIKLILNRLAANNSNQPNQSNLNSQIATEVVKKPLMPGLRENVVLTPTGLQFQETKPKVEIDEEKDFDFPQVNSEQIVSSGKKVAVQQRITYSDGKNICLANVELKNQQGEIIKKLRTNAMGKWLTSLEPGEYFVSVTKSANKSNPDVELTFPITVPESDRPIELPIPKI